MPWTVKDAKVKSPAIKSDAEAAMWVRVANKQLAALLKKGIGRTEAEKQAVAAGAKAVAEMHRKGGPKESSEPSGCGDRILEFVDSRGVSVNVDRERGLISGVKILGLDSRNGRTYLPETIRQAAGLYEGKRVNVDHARSGDSRSYRDRMGKLQNIQSREDGLYGDLFVNPQHMLAEQLFWDAEHAPENVGLSHDVSGKITRRNGKGVVEAINTVRSVDLVADPATTVGLFEDLEAGLAEDEVSAMEIDLKEATFEQLTAQRPDLVEAVTNSLAESAEAKAKDEQIKKLTEELAEMKESAEKAAFEAAISKELQEGKLDAANKTACPELFVESLRKEPDAEKRKAMIEDRKALLDRAGKAGQPISESRESGGDQTLQEMTAAERGRSWR